MFSAGGDFSTYDAKGFGKEEVAMGVVPGLPVPAGGAAGQGVNTHASLMYGIVAHIMLLPKMIKLATEVYDTATATVWDGKKGDIVECFAAQRAQKIVEELHVPESVLMKSKSLLGQPPATSLLGYVAYREARPKYSPGIDSLVSRIRSREVTGVLQSSARGRGGLQF